MSQQRSVYATCPNPKCAEVLRIPAAWADKTVKCKKCGAMVKVKPGVPAPAGAGSGAHIPVPDHLPERNGHIESAPASTPAPQPEPPQFQQPVPQQPPAQPQMPYGMPPGYPPPQGMPPGYPYAPPPGYPQGAPPYGYGPPPQGMPPGYPYAPPPGYPGAPPGYPGAPPGYGYAPPPGYPAAPTAPPGYPPGYGYGPPATQPPAMPVQAPAKPKNAFSLTDQDSESEMDMDQHEHEHHDENQSTSDELSTSISKPKKRYVKESSKAGMVILAVFGVVLLISGGVLATQWSKIMGKGKKGTPTDLANNINNPGSTTPTKEGGGTNPTKASSTNKNPPLIASNLPRRAMFIGITKYLFANSLTGGISNDNLRQLEFSNAAQRIGFKLQIPMSKDNNQLFVLTDAEGTMTLASGARRPMLKEIIQQAYTDYFTTSRDQDHVVFYFGGHAVMNGDKAYLMPVNGDSGDPESLIPVSDLFEKAAACPAQQKVIIFDVCRVDVDGDISRSMGSEPMSEALHKALHSSPAGVQVLTTCTKNQNSYELRSPKSVFKAGSVFLNGLRMAYERGKLPEKVADPNEAIPVDKWIEEMKPFVANMLEDAKKEQMIELSGTAGNAVEYNMEAAAAGKIVYAEPPKGADAQTVRDLFAILDVPPVREGNKLTDERLENVVFFTAESLKDYKSDMTLEQAAKETEKFPIRAATAKALAYLQKGDKPKFDEYIQGETGDAKKAAVLKQQLPLAKIDDDLSELKEAMQKVSEKLAMEESKYWKALFQYTFAQVQMHWAYINEANNALGAIRTDSLPEGKDVGLRLVSVVKMKSKRDVSKIADEAKATLDTMSKEHRGTPFEVAAKRAKSQSLGLEWKSVAAAKPDDKMMEKKP